jgi:hypothetical protein
VDNWKDALKRKAGGMVKSYADWVDGRKNGREERWGASPAGQKLLKFGSLIGVNEHPEDKKLREKDIETTALMDAYRQAQLRQELLDADRKLKSLGVKK